MTLQKRLKRVMKRDGLRVADLARSFGCPYTTAREWVLHGRMPSDFKRVSQRLSTIEKKTGK